MRRRANPSCAVVATCALATALLASHASAEPAPSASPASAPEMERPPRPPLPPAPPATVLPWGRDIELGLGLAFASRLGSKDAYSEPTSARLDPAFGYTLHARWNFYKYVGFTAYFVDVREKLTLPQQSLWQPGLVESASRVYTYVLGARLSLILPLTARARSWVTGGVGCEFVYPRMTVTDHPGAPPPQQGASFQVGSRSDSYADIPFGLGTSFDLIPNWLSLELEMTGAFLNGQSGEASMTAQAVTPYGYFRTVGPLQHFDISVVQTLGLALIL